MARSRRFPYGDDFVQSDRRFWRRGEAEGAPGEGGEPGEEYMGGEELGAKEGASSEGDEGHGLAGPGSRGGGGHEDDGAISDDSRGGGGRPRSRPRGRTRSPQGAVPAAAGARPRSPLLAAAAAAQRQEVQRVSPEKPRVMAMQIEGRNVLRIKLPFKRGAGHGDSGTPSGTPASAAGAAAGGAPGAQAAAGAGLSGQQRQQPAGGARQQQQQEQGEALDTLMALAASIDKPAGSHVALMSKSLTRVGGVGWGVGAGAFCRMFYAVRCALPAVDTWLYCTAVCLGRAAVCCPF